MDRDKMIQRLKLAMEQNGLNKSTLAKRLGIDRQAVRNYLAGRNQPRLDILVDICKELNVSMDWLCGLED